MLNIVSLLEPSADSYAVSKVRGVKPPFACTMFVQSKRAILLWSLWTLLSSLERAQAYEFNVTTTTPPSGKGPPDPWTAENVEFTFQAGNYREPYMSKAAVTTFKETVMFPTVMDKVTPPLINTITRSRPLTNTLLQGPRQRMALPRRLRLAA